MEIACVIGSKASLLHFSVTWSSVLFWFLDIRLRLVQNLPKLGLWLQVFLSKFWCNNLLQKQLTKILNWSWILKTYFGCHACLLLKFLLLWWKSYKIQLSALIIQDIQTYSCREASLLKVNQWETSALQSDGTNCSQSFISITLFVCTLCDYQSKL